MTHFTDIQSQARMLGILPVLLALGGWHLVRGDRLWRALREHLVATRRPASHYRVLIHLDQERARRRRR